MIRYNDDSQTVAAQSVNDMTIGLMGASFDTGNLGVSALAESSIKCILHQWPRARIVLLGTGRQRGTVRRSIGSGEIDMECCPVRFTPKLFVADHYLFIFLWGVIYRVLSVFGIRSLPHAGTAGAISRCDLLADITGGDSFSDIYGKNRFVKGYLQKCLSRVYGKPLILLPQTYGPFASPLVRLLARRVLKGAAGIYSRDQEGVEFVRNLAGADCKVELCPDVAFVLDAVRSETEQIRTIEALKAKGRQVVGLNVSGLLWNGGYTGKNEFGLRCDYRLLVRRIVSVFAGQKGCLVLLVPHVISDELVFENDLNACRDLWDALPQAEKGNSLVVEDCGDPCRIKYAIGQCDFFMGSRMHSTIAAMSQCIPSVGLAYSKKFAGVYETVDVSECVLDLRSLDVEEALKVIASLFDKRLNLCAVLERSVRRAKSRLDSLFERKPQ